MEAFGIAANIMAAVSLSLQLADNIETIKQFWRDMKAAPQEVENILRELELLKGIIEGLRRALTMKHEHGPDPAQIASVLAALLECQRHVDSMTDFASDLQRAMGKRRLMTAFKTVLKKSKIAEFGRHIEQAKATLLLAISVATFLLQEACSERVRLQFCDLRSDIEMRFSTESIPTPGILDPEPITRESFIPRKVVSTHRQISVSDILLWLLQLPFDSPHREYLRNTGNLVGRISWRVSSTVVQESWKANAVKQSTAISIHLPIVQRAFTLECQKALGRWTFTFRISRIVPDDSPIFRICATEDHSSVLRLFESGQASPFDQTASGITLLHAAAAGYCSQIYKFLQDFGVEYSSYDHPQYGKLAPVELTQDFTIFVDGRHQTVQQWLSIDSSDDSRVFHPEYNYQNVVHIWNAIMETEEQISDELIITLLQGPLRIPRQNSSNVTKTPAMYKYSTPLLLFCFYFLFQQDPYGSKIRSATLHSRYLRKPVPFYEYTQKYWDGEHWKRMLSHCKGLDFRALAERQQGKFTGFTWSRSTDTGCGKSTRKRVATFNFCADEEWIVRIGPLEKFQVVFEFEGEDMEGDSFEDDQRQNGGSEKSQPAPFFTSPKSNGQSTLRLIWIGFLMKKGIPESWPYTLLISFFFFVLLYYLY